MSNILLQGPLAAKLAALAHQHNQSVEALLEAWSTRFEQEHAAPPLPLAQHEQQLYQVLFEQSNDGIHITNLDRFILRVNQQMCAITGYRAEEMIGRHISEFSILTPEERAEMDTMREQLIAGESIPPFERTLLRKDGTICQVEVDLTALYEEGQPRYIQALVRDITERKQALRALRESQRFNELITNNLMDVVIWVNGTGHILYVSPGCLRLLGYSPAALDRFFLPDLFHPEEMPLVAQMLQQGQIPAEGLTFQQRLRHKNGEYIWVEITAQIVHNPESGEDEGVIGVIRDIRERQAAQNALRESEGRLRLFFAEAPIGMIMRGRLDAPLEVNRTFAHFIGYSFEEIQALAALDFLTRISHPEDIPHEKALIEEVVAGQRTSYNFLKRYIRRDGAVVWGEQTTFFISDPHGQIRQAMSMVIDVTAQKQAQDALQKTQKLLREAGKLTRVGGWEVDLTHPIIVCTEEVYTIYEIEAFPMDWFNGGRFYSPETLTLLTEHWLALITTGLPFDVEVPMTTAKGNQRWVRLIGKPEIRQGQTVRVYGVIQDVTNRRQVEEALEHETTLMRTILDTIPDLIFVKDRQGNYIKINDSAVQHFGKSSEVDIIGATDEEVVSPERARLFREHDRQVMSTRQPILNLEMDDEQHRSWWLNTKVPLVDSRGEVQGVVVVSRDITAQKQAAEALRAAKENLELFIQVSNDGLWDWNLESNAIYFSPRWKAMFGYSDGELPNALEAWEKVIPPDMYEKVALLLANYLAGQADTLHGTLSFRHKKGHLVHVLLRARYLTNAAGQPIRMIGALTDISETVLAKDAAEAANRAKTAFLANMSHELRTPLNAILGFAQLMGYDSSLSANHRENLNIILQSGTHLLELINDVLEVSKIEVGSSQLNLKPTDFQQVINHLKEMLSIQARKKNLR